MGGKEIYYIRVTREGEALSFVADLTQLEVASLRNILGRSPYKYEIATPRACEKYISFEDLRATLLDLR